MIYWNQESDNLYLLIYELRNFLSTNIMNHLLRNINLKEFIIKRKFPNQWSITYCINNEKYKNKFSRK
jgi:hypothetical protein